MKKIYVRKILKYDPTFGGKLSKYKGYSLIGLQKIDPRIEKGKRLNFNKNVSLVFCSELKRGQETAKTYGFEFKILDLLNEIKFNLGDLLAEHEYSKFGSALVRKRFVEKFIKDELEEKRIAIKKRITNLLKLLRELPEGSYMLISHSFFMKILETYLKEDNLFEEPILVKKYFDINHKTFDFGKGFEFNVK